jgi:hypothetical protein
MLIWVSVVIGIRVNHVCHDFVDNVSIIASLPKAPPSPDQYHRLLIHLTVSHLMDINGEGRDKCFLDSIA